MSSSRGNDFESRQPSRADAVISGERGLWPWGSLDPILELPSTTFPLDSRSCAISSSLISGYHFDW